MKFEDYLIEKKIDPKAFETAAPEEYRGLKALFDQVHPASFTQQKLFLINNIRRKYQLKDTESVKKTAPSKTMRPKIKPLKPKTS